jgi:hypothetical protein
MTIRMDIAGQRFGRLVAARPVHRVQPSGRKRMIWECACDCGKTSTVDPWDLRTGRIQSCGCLRAEMRARIGGIHARFDDVTGQRFGRLIALAPLRGRSEGSGRARTLWNCLCDCGQVKAVDATALRTGHIQSCGCLRLETATQQMTTHGYAGTRIHKIWKGIVQRCTNPDNPAWPDYGGRGITVCPEWLTSFENFLRDMGATYKRRLTIDRIENDKGYSAANCRWATKLVQANNTRSNRWVEFDGKTRTVAQWGRHTGTPAHKISYRLNAGWSVASALGLAGKPSQMELPL